MAIMENGQDSQFNELELFNFNLGDRKKRTKDIKNLNDCVSFWKDCQKDLKNSKDYYLYNNFKKSNWGIVNINPTQDPYEHLVGLRSQYLWFVGDIDPDHTEHREYVGALLHTYLHLCISDFNEKLDMEIFEIEQILKERENWNGPLYKLADKLRTQASTKNISYRDAYREGSEKYLYKYEKLTCKRIERAYDKARAESLI